MKSVAEFAAEYKVARAADIAATRLSGVPWAISPRGRIVFRCPVCSQVTAADIDTSEGLRNEIGHGCECGAEIKIELEWRIEPELVDVTIQPL